VGTSAAVSGAAAEGAWLNVWATYLSGPLRGRSVRIDGEALIPSEAGSGPLTLDPAGKSPGAASLQRTQAGYRLLASRRQAVWVNGEAIHTRMLESGDLIELESGLLLLFRVCPPGATPLDAVGEPIRTHLLPLLWARALGSTGRAKQLWRRSRLLVLIVIVTVAGALSTFQTRDLERQLAHEQQRVSGLADLLGKLQGQALKRAEIDALRDELSKGLVETGERVKLLEAGSAVVGVIARASGSVAFIQGSFGFEDPATKRPLRIAVNKNGSPLRTPDGRPLITLEGSGPPVQVRFTGTAFVVSGDGVLLTSRHVALPWEDEASLPAIRRVGLEPVMHRMRGYLPGSTEPFDLRFLGASDSHDVAALQGERAARALAPLPLSADLPVPGETVILLGYPTGIRALLARAGDTFVQELSQRPNMDDDEAAGALARAGMVRPLASRGIVGQASGEAIVYDAQTTAGGSGGPVLNAKGEVIAISRATLVEFGGSNLGVPATHAARLLHALQIGMQRPPAVAR